MLWAGIVERFDASKATQVSILAIIAESGFQFPSLSFQQDMMILGRHPSVLRCLLFGFKFILHCQTEAFQTAERGEVAQKDRNSCHHAFYHVMLDPLSCDPPLNKWNLSAGRSGWDLDCLVLS